MGRLSDALKALFGSNKTSGTYVPLVTSNGTPDGNITTANIAALLGGLRATTYTDLNDTPQGVTVGNTGSGCLNVPDGWAGGIAISANRNRIYQLQILVNYTLTKLYIRLKWGDNWNMVDLASMLSALTSMGSLSADCDTLFDMGVYHVASTSATTSYHTPTNYGTLIVFSGSKENAAYCVQVFVERNTTNFRVFIRTGNRQGGYYAWKILATTTDFSS